MGDRHEGVPLGAGEMLIRPLDLAKVGQALLDDGTWIGAQVVPTGWPALSFAQSSAFEPLYGLLWWRAARVTSVGLTTDVLAQWKTAGLDPTTEAKLEPLVGRTYRDASALYTEVTGALTSAEWLALKSLLTKGDHLPWSRNLGSGGMGCAHRPPRTARAAQPPGAQRTRQSRRGDRPGDLGAPRREEPRGAARTPGAPRACGRAQAIHLSLEESAAMASFSREMPELATKGASSVLERQLATRYLPMLQGGPISRNSMKPWSNRPSWSMG